MNTRYQGNRWAAIPRTIASLLIGVSLIVSGCANTPPPTTITPNQTVPNTTPPEPVPVPNATPNNPTPPPPTPAPNITQTPPPAPNITVNTTPPPPPVPAPNTTQNTTPPPDPTPTPNATPNETQVLVSYKKVQIVFNMFCASPECHDGTGNTSLTLLPAVSYKMLVNVASDFLKDKLRVKPGAPAQSVIMIMITDTEHCTVTPQAIDIVKQWILEGALNN